MTKPGRRLLVVLSVAGCLLAVTAAGAESNAPAIRPPTLPPMPPPSKSPTELFRQLLNAPVAEREKLLAVRPPASRPIIENALREYEVLPARDREVRLQALELEWHLNQILRVTPSNRVDRLALVPQTVRQKVEQRIELWDQLPADVRSQLLENALGIRVMLGAGTTGSRNLDGLSPSGSARAAADIARVEAMSGEQQERLKASFRRLFELSEREKETIFRDFTEAQRSEMRKAILAFQILPEAQRDLCLEGLTKFSSLTAAQRQEFLKNCERWKAMSPTEREAWRKLVASRSRKPPMPPGKTLPGQPPLPPLPRKSPSLATNR